MEKTLKDIFKEQKDFQKKFFKSVYIFFIFFLLFHYFKNLFSQIL